MVSIHAAITIMLLLNIIQQSS
uniref:Uncharacterized protein n=1 Tax=Arundo donax TaxID=35708 RepID=A0A0A9BNA3_ARUDO